MAHSTDDAFLSANGNWSFLLSGAANSTFMERPLIRNDTPSNQATLAQARSFPLIVNAFWKYITYTFHSRFIITSSLTPQPHSSPRSSPSLSCFFPDTPHYPYLMQRPTCTDIRVRSVSDALVIFYAVSKGVLPIVSRRLDSEERRCIRSGSVYVWEERGPDAEATGVRFRPSSPLSVMLTLFYFFFQLGIERWTDGIRWGPSRVRYWKFPVIYFPEH